MKYSEPVSKIMTKNVHSINLEDGLKAAIRTVKKHHIRHLPVVNGTQIAGIISSSDLNRLTFSNLFEEESGHDEAILEMLSVSQIMSDKPKVVGPEESIDSVAKIFAEESFHSLPVVEDGNLVGIVTTTDVIKYFLSN